MGKTLNMIEGRKVKALIKTLSEGCPSILVWSCGPALPQIHDFLQTQNGSSLGNPTQSFSQGSLHKARVHASSQPIHFREPWHGLLCSGRKCSSGLPSGFCWLNEACSGSFRLIQSGWQKRKHLWWHLKQQYDDNMRRSEALFVFFLVIDL